MRRSKEETIVFLNDGSDLKRLGRLGAGEARTAEDDGVGVSVAAAAAASHLF